ncbi:hypothetical protein [Kribbella sp. NPDC004875]|uniref:hypothetical protein n=1 Tax=Kribbella sp. NPDC004875 TaxID=3364107 RepID=UPI0036766AD5
MTSAVSTEGSPQSRARRALGLAFGVVAPDALALRDGTVRLRDSRERLARKALRRLERRLARRAADVSDDRLLAEAVAFVGAELDRNRGGAPADGATAALDSLLDLPGLPAEQESEARALLQDVLDGNRLDTEADLRRLATARAPQDGLGRPFAADLVRSATSLNRDIEQLSRTTPPTLRPTDRPRRPVGDLHRPAGPGTNTPKVEGSSRGFFGWVRALVSDTRAAAGRYRAERDRRAEAQYEEFRQLSAEWRETQAGAGVRPRGDIERDLTNLSQTIRSGGHPAPSVPWDGVQVVAPDRTQESAITPAERFQARVRRQVRDLETAAADHEHRAEVRTASAEAARRQAAALYAQADEQAEAKDASSGERARRLRVRAVARLRVADRHVQIATSCTAAAEQARTAADANRALLAATTAAGTTPEGTAIAAEAVEEVRAYERASAATLPAVDVQHNGLPSGRLPHLTKLSEELNAALAERGSTYRFTPDFLHRTLRGESRRVLSPDGMVLTIGNDPRADAGRLVQIHLRLDPGELQEVLDSPIVFDEAQVGQVVQAGHSVTTAAMQNSGTTVGAGLRTVTQMLPPTSKLKAVAALVSPGVEVSTGRGHTDSGGATETAQTGAVEALRGEFLRYRSTRPRWNWQIRESAAAEWSPVHVVDSGTDRDAATLDLGFIHTYTVPPPTETTDLQTLGLASERSTAMPEHMATRVDGLNDLCDRTMRELQQRLGPLDRVGHDRLRSLIAEDGMIRLDETTQPGGVWRLITNGGKPVAWAQLETVADLESAELVSDSSPDHKLEVWRVGNSGSSGAQAVNSTRTLGATVSTALSDIGSSTADLGPGLRAGRNTTVEDTASTADLGSRWSTQRIAPTVGVKMRLRHKVTVHRLDRGGSFSTDGEGVACLRMAERDAFRYGLPVPADALVRDADGAPQRGPDGRLLLRGDPHPTDLPLELPPWLGNGPGQLRGAGPAMIRELTGADEALRGFLAHLQNEDLLPPLDENGHPLPAELAGLDPALQLSRTENWERARQQIAKHRLETGYDHAAQDRLTFQLTEHRTGHPPRVRSFQISIEQHFDRATPIGLADNDMVVNVDIGVSTSGRSTTRTRSLPWSARLGLTNAPADGRSGATPKLGVSLGRSSRGRSLGGSTTRSAYRMTVAESGSRVAVFDVPHTIRISEILSDGSTVPVAESEGSARVWLDSEFCGPAEPAELSVPGRVDPGLLQTATIQHADARNPIKRLTDAVPSLGRGDSAALHHLSGFLAPRNLISRPELLTTEYRTALVVTPAPSTPLEAVRQRGLTPQRSTLTVSTRVENLRYVGSGSPILAELNLTIATTSSSSGVSTGATAGVNAGTGSVSADGQSHGGALGLTRSTTVSSSASQSATTGVERTLMRDGQHYQFTGDLVMEAQLRAGGAKPRAIPLETGAVVLTLPERDALRLYGRGELDLPPRQVADAVERLLNGNLELPRRTTIAVVRRYKGVREDAGPLAAEHTNERLMAKLLTEKHPVDERLDAVLNSAEKLARLSREPNVPPHYRQSMAAAQVVRATLNDKDGNPTDIFREVSAAVEEHSPQAMDDPVLISALRGDFAGTRWRNELDDMLDPRGFVRELPVRDGTSTRNVRVRVRLRFTGPMSRERDGNDGESGNGFNLSQHWALREQNRSVTESTSYGGTLEVSGSDGMSGSAGAGADLGTSTTASTSEMNTRISTGLAIATGRVKRDYQVIVEVEDSAAPGGPATRPATRREATGKMRISVPTPVFDSVPPSHGPEVSDHRSVVLPGNYLVETTQPYRTGEAAENALFDAAYERLGRPDMLGTAGVQAHSATLESALGGGSRLVAFQEMAGTSGYELVPLAIPGQTARVVSVRVRAEVSGLELVSRPAKGATTQLGENTRELRVAQLTARSNHVLPGSGTIGGTTPGGELTASASTSRRVSEQDTGTVGARHETGAYESGQVVTVKVSVDYHLDVQRLRLGRRSQPRVERSDTVHRAASGEAYLTMFRHEYDAMRARMEAGQEQTTPARRVRTVQVTATADEQHPYQPLVGALEQARRDDVKIRLTLRTEDGRRTVYVAHPNGTMTSRTDSAFAKAFATLHPRLALLAEGRVDLRDLYTPDAPPRQFTSAVVDALQQRGIPAAVLAETDSHLRHDTDEKTSAPARRGHTANPATGMTIQ